MSFDGRSVANFVLDVCDEKGRHVTNLGLQKLVYFCHVWCLIKLGRPLVKHGFEAWRYGPVLPYLYHEFKEFGSAPIRGKRSQRVNPDSGNIEVVTHQFDDETASLLLSVTDLYGRFSAETLSRLSHIEDGPWHRVWNHAGKINPGMKIDDLEIQKYYSAMRAPFLIQ